MLADIQQRDTRRYRVTPDVWLGVFEPFTPVDVPCVVVVVPFGPVTVVPVGPDPGPVGVPFPTGPVPVPVVPMPLVPAAPPEPTPAPAEPPAAAPPPAPPPAPPAPPPPPPPPAAKVVPLVSNRAARTATPNLYLFAVTIAYLSSVASSGAT